MYFSQIIIDNFFNKSCIRNHFYCHSLTIKILITFYLERGERDAENISNNWGEGNDPQDHLKINGKLKERIYRRTDRRGDRRKGNRLVLRGKVNKLLHSINFYC